jgi:hypothetical protein
MDWHLQYFDVEAEAKMARYKDPDTKIPERGDMPHELKGKMEKKAVANPHNHHGSVHPNLQYVQMSLELRKICVVHKVPEIQYQEQRL